MPYSLRVKVKKLRYKGMLTDKECDRLCKALEQQPCEDAISRQAVVEWIKESLNQYASTYSYDMLNMWMLFEEQITAMPSVTPQPKVGEWLEKEINSDKVGEWQSARCSVCDKYHTTPYMYYFDNYKFCPNCGARMEVSE